MVGLGAERRLDVIASAWGGWWLSIVVISWKAASFSGSAPQMKGLKFAGVWSGLWVVVSSSWVAWRLVPSGWGYPESGASLIFWAVSQTFAGKTPPGNHCIWSFDSCFALTFDSHLAPSVVRGKSPDICYWLPQKHWFELTPRRGKKKTPTDLLLPLCEWFRVIRLWNCF